MLLPPVRSRRQPASRDTVRGVARRDAMPSSDFRRIRVWSSDGARDSSASSRRVDIRWLRCRRRARLETMSTVSSTASSSEGLPPADAWPGDAGPRWSRVDNLGEQAAATDPHDPDTGGDGLSDGQEVALGRDPLVDQDVPEIRLPSRGVQGVSSLVALLVFLALMAGRELHRRPRDAPENAL